MNTLKMTMAIVLLAIVSACSSCAGKNPPTIARDVAVSGRALVEAVNAVQKEIIAAEARNAIPRNAAVTAMEKIKITLAAADQAAKGLDTLVTMTAGSTEATSTMERIESALALVNSGLLDSIVPIGDAATREQVVKLATTVTGIIGEINKQLLRR